MPRLQMAAFQMVTTIASIVQRLDKMPHFVILVFVLENKNHFKETAGFL